MQNPTEKLSPTEDRSSALAVASGSASEGITPAPWTWEHHPLRDGLMVLSAGETDVILPTGDNECVWMDIKPADRELIRRSPELMAALEDLMQIVEGVRNERWAADGRRLKDTPEWCRLYVLRCAILRGEPNIRRSDTSGGQS